MHLTDVDSVDEVIAEMYPENTTTFGNTTFPDSVGVNWNEWTNRQIILGILLGILTIVTIVSNAIVILIFATSRRKLGSPTHLLLLNMAISDLLVGIVVMPTLASLTIFNYKWIFGDFYCIAWEYVHFLLCAASTLTIVGVSVERYIGVKYPLKSKKIMTRKRIIMFMIIIWVSAALLTAIPLSYWPKRMSKKPHICLVNLRTEIIIFMATCVYWIPITLTMLFYYLIYRNALRSFPHSEDSRYKLQGEKNDNENLTAERLKQTRLTKSIVRITAVIILFYGPVFGAFVIKALDSPYFTFHILMTVAWIRYSCSAINPFMYALAVPGYKQEFRERLFGGRRSGSTLESSEISPNATTKSLLRHRPKTENTQPGPKVDVYCTQCGNLTTKDFSDNDARCNICDRKVLCSSWVLPKAWGTPSYFMCPICSTLRFFDGTRACFCRNCGHKFKPIEQQPPATKLAALANPQIQPSINVCIKDHCNQIKLRTKTDRIAEINTTSNIPLVHILKGDMQSKLRTSETSDLRRNLNDEKVNGIRRLRESVIGTLMERRSRLSNASNSTKNNDKGKDADADWMCIQELEEIIAQLESTLSISNDSNYKGNLKY